MNYSTACLLQELETIEEQWRTERSELVALVGRLQDENRRIQKLQESPSHGSSHSADGSDDQGANDATANLMHASDFQVMQRLRNRIEKQREDIKNMDEKMQDRANEIDGVSSLLLD